MLIANDQYCFCSSCSIVSFITDTFQPNAAILGVFLCLLWCCAFISAHFSAVLSFHGSFCHFAAVFFIFRCFSRCFIVFLDLTPFQSLFRCFSFSNAVSIAFSCTIVVSAASPLLFFLLFCRCFRSSVKEPLSLPTTKSVKHCLQIHANSISSHYWHSCHHHCRRYLPLHATPYKKRKTHKSKQ